MTIFRNRPLFLVCTAFMVAAAVGFGLFGVAELGRPLGWLWLILLCLFVAGAAVGTLYLWKRNRRRVAVCLWVTATLVVVALIQSYITFAGEQTVYFHSLEGEPVTVTGVVTDRRGSGGYLTSFALDLESVGGKDADGLAVLTCHYRSELEPGNRVTLEATLLPLDTIAENGYTANALRGDGYVVGLLSEDEGAATVTEREVRSLRVAAGNLRRTLGAKLDLLVGDEAEGLPSALLLGDKTYLSGQVQRDFSRTGTSHILSISGLHMTLLFGMLEAILRFARVPRKGRVVLLGSLALFYLIIVGFLPSATRAVLMLGMAYVSVMCSARADTLTSLGLAGALILGVTPWAVADAGFWMSFLATFGLVTVSPLLTSPDTEQPPRSEVSLPRRIIRRARTAIRNQGVALAIGVAAVTLTLFVTALVIGEMGVLSPIATILLTPLSGAILITSLFALLLGATPIGVVAGVIAGWCSRVMITLTAWMGEPSWSVISLRSIGVLILAILFTAAAMVLLCLRPNKRRRLVFLVTILVGWTVIGGVSAVSLIADDEKVTVSYIQPSSQSDMLVLVSGREGVICDFSNGSLSSMQAATQEAKRQGATEFSAIMLTHYHNRTIGTLGEILAQEKVRALWLPEPTTDEDYYRLRSCLEKAEIAGVEVLIYREGQDLHLFSTYRISASTTTLSRSVQKVHLLALARLGADGTVRESLVYAGSSVMESDLAADTTALVSTADTVIWGNHGPTAKHPFGEGLTYRDNALVVLSEEGDVANYLVWPPHGRFRIGPAHVVLGE